MLEESEILTTIAQLAIGVAGFSGIAIVFKRQPGKLIDVEAYRIAILFANSFAAMFLSLLPFPLVYLFGDEEVVWRIASGAVALFTALFLNYYLRNTLRFRREVPELFNPLHLVFTRTGHAFNLVLQVASAGGLFPARHSAIFVFGVLWLLFHSTFQFGRILFVQPPAWYVDRMTEDHVIRTPSVPFDSHR